MNQITDIPEMAFDPGGKKKKKTFSESWKG